VFPRCYTHQEFHRGKLRLRFCFFTLNRLPSSAPHRREELKKRGGQVDRLISTGKLKALLPLYIRPINVVVFHEPEGNLFFEKASRLDAFSAYPFRT
jgi:hypothetical protein